MILESNSFQNEGKIPVKYTCDGDNITPHLKWSSYPLNTRSFALICDDPDAPIGTWVHWILFNIPMNINEFQENFNLEDYHSQGIKAGYNNFRRIEYGGPCPPGGEHRYYFKLYALDTIIGADHGITKKQLLTLIEGHVLTSCQIMGTYEKKRR